MNEGKIEKNKMEDIPQYGNNKSDLEIMAESIVRNRVEIIKHLFDGVEFEGIDQEKFLQECLQDLEKYDKKQYKMIHAYELQKVHNDVMYGGLGEL